ncbi:hypothetical protein EYC84_007151 [Monilinia fructicola]|uniref:Uncharacterized protein n=1 Tax=Monilinia fructicola TaxID=38448 RepID=A0A5M9K9T5_MONFR|nr:hypothetical protein EYC84_007151 [Monilinia fructicola]
MRPQRPSTSRWQQRSTDMKAGRATRYPEAEPSTTEKNSPIPRRAQDPPVEAAAAREKSMQALPISKPSLS